MSYVPPEQRKRAFRRRKPRENKIGEGPDRAFKIPIESKKVVYHVRWKKKIGQADYQEIYARLARFCEVNEAWGYNACQKQIMKKGFYEDKIVKITKLKFVK